MEFQDRYEICKLLRKSRTGGLYLAVDQDLKRSVISRRFFTEKTENFLPSYEKKFVEEVRRAAIINHPHINTILDGGIDEYGPFVITIDQKTRTLNQQIADHDTFDESHIRFLAEQIIDALDHMHCNNIIHGAITGRSIVYFHEKNFAPLFMINDLCLRHLTNALLGEEYIGLDLVDSTLMAPELFTKYKPTEASDLYSVGHLIYMAMALGHPFANESYNNLKQLHSSGAMPPLSKFSNVSSKFEKWIHALIEPDLSKRTSTAKEALDSLKKIAR